MQAKSVPASYCYTETPSAMRWIVRDGERVLQQRWDKRPIIIDRQVVYNAEDFGPVWRDVPLEIANG